VILLAVNALVFTMIGLQLPTVLAGLRGRDPWSLCAAAAILTLAVILIRFIWVFPATWLPRAVVPGLAKRDPMPPVGFIVVMGWTGMRGIVSLAAALALPETLGDGEPFVERPLIVFLVYAVTLFTLIIPTLTLPPLLKLLDLKDRESIEDDEVRARIAMARAAARHIEHLNEKSGLDKTLLEEIGRGYRRQLNRLEPNLAAHAYSALDPAEQGKRVLLLELIELERGVLHDLRSRGGLYDEVYHRLSDELDLEALRVRRNMRPI
jgi:CPA1 family monovalent cation:H+ antiporter